MNIPKILDEVRVKFLKQDFQLLEARVHERTITNRISMYLQDFLPEWHVDCEYNRHGVFLNPKRDSDGKKRFPDIIVHNRCTSKNLLVIEAKPSWASDHLKRKDRIKIARLVEMHGYQHAYIMIYRAKPAGIEFEEVK